MFASRNAPLTEALEERLVAAIKDVQPIFEETSLRNGARIISACTGPYPKASVAVHFDAGSRREAPHEQGLNHFFEHLPFAAFRIAHNGTDFLEFCAARGWNFTIRTTDQLVTFGITCPDYETADALKIISELINYDRDLLAQVFETERLRILNEIDQHAAEAGRIAWKTRMDVLMPGTPYQHPVTGTREHVESYSFAQVIGQRDRLFSAPNATCTVSGAHGAVSTAVDFFNTMQFPSESPKVEPMPPSNPPAWNNIPAESVKESALFNGVALEMIFPLATGYDKRERVLQVEVTTMVSSLLMKTLSNERGLSYDVRAEQMIVDDRSFLVVKTNVAPENLAKTKELCETLLSDICTHVTSKDLAHRYQGVLARCYSCTTEMDWKGALSWQAAIPTMVLMDNSEYLAILKSLTINEVHGKLRAVFAPGAGKTIYYGTKEALAAAGVWKEA